MPEKPEAEENRWASEIGRPSKPTCEKLPPLTPREEIGRLLLPFFELHRRPFRPAILSLFAEALGDLTPREVELGFSEAAKRLRYFPTPAEVRQLLHAALERLPPRGNTADPRCPRCEGTGWKRVNRQGSQFVVECACRKKNG